MSVAADSLAPVQRRGWLARLPSSLIAGVSIVLFWLVVAVVGPFLTT